MVENDMTTLHVMNWGGLPLGVEEDEAEQTREYNNEEDEEPTRCDEMQWRDDRKK